MKILPYGHHALLVECADAAEVAALHAELLRRRAAATLPLVLDIVPAERTVLIDGLPDHVSVAALAAAVPTWTLDAARSDPQHPAPKSADPTQPFVEIAVHYDAPDLPEVAASWGVSVPEVAKIHAGHEYRVAFCGFMPGFAYLTGLPERFHLPRRPTPRPSVPAGSVAVAGPYTGVYPRESPGGWHLIGTTDADLWDLGRAEPALLTPGTVVRFVPVASGTEMGAAR